MAKRKPRRLGCDPLRRWQLLRHAEGDQLARLAELAGAMMVVRRRLGDAEWLMRQLEWQQQWGKR